MAKRKGSSNKVDRTMIITKNKARRLQRHLKKHPNDEQSKTAIGSLKPMGGKTPSHQGMKIVRSVHFAKKDGSSGVHDVVMNIGRRANAKERYQLRMEAKLRRLANKVRYEKWGAAKKAAAKK